MLKKAVEHLSLLVSVLLPTINGNFSLIHENFHINALVVRDNFLFIAKICLLFKNFGNLYIYLFKHLSIVRFRKKLEIFVVTYVHAIELLVNAAEPLVIVHGTCQVGFGLESFNLTVGKSECNPAANACLIRQLPSNRSAQKALL